MAIEQLELFPLSYEEKLEKRIDELENIIHNVRKGIFARHGELAKMYLKIDQEHEEWKSSLCRKHEHAIS
jgi:hypothetical protein